MYIAAREEKRVNQIIFSPAIADIHLMVPRVLLLYLPYHAQNVEQEPCRCSGLTLNEPENGYGSLQRMSRMLPRMVW